MENLTFPRMVTALVKPGQAILEKLRPEEVNTLHMLIGLSGEVGELTDALKKPIIYQKLADRENIVEELGDIEFYLEGLRQGLGITRGETLVSCENKLAKRYGEKYSDKAAQERLDKQ